MSKKDTLDPAPAPAETSDNSRQIKVRWDDSNLKSSYANVCNVSSTRSEIVVVFGLNQAWERGQEEMKIELTNRIILSPVAAKQMADLLNRVMGEYESRFGKLTPEPRREPA